MASIFSASAGEAIRRVISMFLPPYSRSISFSHSLEQASLGIRQSPRGERVTLPTLGPSGRQERLNCWIKNRR